MATEDWMNDPEVLFHHTRAEYLDSILRNGILPMDFCTRRLYYASLQPYGYTSFFSNGGPYLRFAQEHDLTTSRIKEMSDQDVLDILRRNGIRPTLEMAGHVRSTLIDTLEGLSPFEVFLKKEVDENNREEIVLVVATKKRIIIFPHREMYDFEVCVDGEVSPDEIIDVYPGVA